MAFEITRCALLSSRRAKSRNAIASLPPARAVCHATRSGQAAAEKRLRDINKGSRRSEAKLACHQQRQWSRRRSCALGIRYDENCRWTDYSPAASSVALKNNLEEVQPIKEMIVQVPSVDASETFTQQLQDGAASSCGNMAKMMSAYMNCVLMFRRVMRYLPATDEKSGIRWLKRCINRQINHHRLRIRDSSSTLQYQNAKKAEKEAEA